MSQIIQIDDDTKTIEWGRGDSDFKKFQVLQSDGSPDDITGRTYRLTTSESAQPHDVDTPIFTLTGIITDAPNGIVEFAPTPTDTDIEHRTLYYDIEETDGGGRVKTLLIGTCLITADISR